MRLSFHNNCRSFDEIRNCICFRGYDSTIEVSFYLEAGALMLLCPNLENTQTAYLQMFDDSLEQIYQVADKVYIKDGQGKGTYSYSLAAADF